MVIGARGGGEIPVCRVPEGGWGFDGGSERVDCYGGWECCGVVEYYIFRD